MTMQELIERLEKCSEPDRGLDAEIDCALRFRDLRPARPDDFDGKYGYSEGNLKCEHGFLMAHSNTRSIDEALELIPAKYGSVSLAINERGKSSARLGHPYVYGNAFNAATAIVICALRALADGGPQT